MLASSIHTDIYRTHPDDAARDETDAGAIVRMVDGLFAVHVLRARRCHPEWVLIVMKLLERITARFSQLHKSLACYNYSPLAESLDDLESLARLGCASATLALRDGLHCYKQSIRHSLLSIAVLFNLTLP